VSTALIVPAAGSGRRLGLGRPKAVIDIGGLAMIRRSLSCFVGVADIVQAVVVAPPGFVLEVQRALVGLEWPGCEVRVVAGAATRQDSVRCGIESIAHAPEIICIHDCARPMVPRATIEAVLRAARENGAATAASRPRDSVREDVEGGTTRALDRNRIWLVETPQAFGYELIRRAHEHARATGLRLNDDATAVEACNGQRVTIVESEGVNLKVTLPADLAIVRALIGG
jgi:2-C-methyl-D-erythritol 4-phosphate cytidylyltransferase